MRQDEEQGLFAQARAAARARGLRPGPYGVCPMCDTPVEELVRIGEWLVADPCAHHFLRLPHLRGMYSFGPQKWTKRMQQALETDQRRAKEKADGQDA